MFAVIKTGGKQYRVAADDVLKIERVAGDEGSLVELPEVLMVGEGADTTIGAPLVDGAMVTAEILQQGRARKLIAFKKRRRQNSRRTIGHRQHFSKIQILEILTGGAKPKKKASGKSAAESAVEYNPADAPKKEAAAEKKSAPKKEAAAEKKAAPKKEAVKADAADKEEPKKAAPKKEAKSEAPSAGAPMFTAPKGEADKLTDIVGIGPVAERQLNEQGITTFAQIAALTKDEIVKVDEYMPFSADQITDWQSQAKKLAK